MFSITIEAAVCTLFEAGSVTGKCMLNIQISIRLLNLTQGRIHSILLESSIF